MIRRVNRTALSVDDLDHSMALHRDTFGLRMAFEVGVDRHARLDDVVGVVDVVARIVRARTSGLES